MQIFRRHKYDSLDEALKNAHSCSSLSLLFFSYNIGNRGQDFLKLSNLTELWIQSPIVHDNGNFNLPEQIGNLKRLKKLTLLNFPLELFPEWIFELTSLKYLMVRGNDISVIPEKIRYLTNLKELRVENCMLESLPTSLSKMNHLKKLGLSDTRLKHIRADMFPQSLKEINFCGTGCYKIEELSQLKFDLKKTKIYP